MFSLFLILCVSQGIGIRPSICSAVYAWYTNMAISLLLIVAIFVSYWTLSTTLKQHFHAQYEQHRSRLAGITIGMELALVSYFTFGFVPVQQSEAFNGIAQMIVNQ